MALTYTPENFENTKAVDFILPATDGKTYSLSDFQISKPLVIMFICNHCPYVKAIEDRLIQLGKDLKNLGIHLVAICSNDPINYPDDSFENLKKRAELKSYTFPYLHDADQSVAKQFGAVCTPDFFVYNSKGLLTYRGRLDDSWKDETKVTKRELYQACLDLLESDKLSFQQIPSMGCSIKWTKP